MPVPQKRLCCVSMAVPQKKTEVVGRRQTYRGGEGEHRGRGRGRGRGKGRGREGEGERERGTWGGLSGSQESSGESCRFCKPQRQRINGRRGEARESLGVAPRHEVRQSKEG
eukprot:3903317-Rhodomonas_salina.2